MLAALFVPDMVLEDIWNCIFEMDHHWNPGPQTGEEVSFREFAGVRGRQEEQTRFRWREPFLQGIARKPHVPLGNLQSGTTHSDLLPLGHYDPPYQR